MLRTGTRSPTQTARPSTVELTIPNRPEWIAIARLVLAGIANSVAMPVEDVNDAKLAVAEACTDVLSLAESSLQLLFQVDADMLTIRVRASGSALARAIQAEREGTSDLGAVLVRALMDAVDVRVGSGDGIVLTMQKRLRR